MQYNQEIDKGEPQAAEEVKVKKAKNKGMKPGKAKGKTEKKGKTAKAATGTGRVRTGVGATIRALIAKKPDRPSAEIAELAKNKHPDSSTNAACVAWYKNDMRKKGEIK